VGLIGNEGISAEETFLSREIEIFGVSRLKPLYLPSQKSFCNGFFQQEQSNMNKDQVKGAAKDVVGKIQEEAGKAVGSKEQQIKGLSKQISGKAQKGVGDVKQAVEDFKKS